jgi:hypothetical protein
VTVESDNLPRESVIDVKDSIKSAARLAARATGVTDQLNTVGRRLSELSGKLDTLDERLKSLEQQASAVDRGTQIALALQYRELWGRGVRCDFGDVEFRNFSQNGEDGILWYIFSIIGAASKTCVEMSSGDGRQCNSTNLIINHGWTGLLFDGREEYVARGKRFFASHPDTFIYPPKFVNAWITAENADSLIVDNGFRGEIDLFSLDLDGVDYWIWNSIKSISPRVVIAEVQVLWGSERAVTVPYNPDFRGEVLGGLVTYCGASLPAFVKLARKKGYRLVGCQRYGLNAIFLRDDVGQDAFPEVSASDCFRHPLQKQAYDEFRPMVADRAWVEV